MEGTKMIYDALDALQMPPKMAELSEKIAELDEAIMQRMERDRKEIERLIRSVKAWEEKTKVYEEALETACEEVETLCTVIPCLHFDIDDTYCDNDCGVCLKNYVIGKGQERLDMQKACQDEEEGRKRMDVEDQRGEFAKCDSLAEQIIEKGRELEEKMRR